jgi:hypothetical protein
VLRYKVGSVIVEPSNLLSMVEADKGVEIDFASNILVFVRRSLMYLCCER